jgi:hypothetical protein
MVPVTNVYKQLQNTHITVYSLAYNTVTAAGQEVKDPNITLKMFRDSWAPAEALCNMTLN